MTADLASPSASVDPDELIAKARACLEHAYAPYSQFPVAAAVVDENGRIFVGVNVENASYGLTLCAERVAIFSAISSGSRRIVAIAVTSKNAVSLPPCGACRQVMSEFCGPETPVYGDPGATHPGQPNHWTVGSLLPDAFGPLHFGTASKSQ